MKRKDCSDPLLEEIWAIRRRLGARYGNDPARLVEHYMEYQKQFADRLVPPPANSGFKPIGSDEPTA
jgi:hypothetical protein